MANRQNHFVGHWSRLMAAAGILALAAGFSVATPEQAKADDCSFSDANILLPPLSGNGENNGAPLDCRFNVMLGNDNGHGNSAFSGTVNNNEINFNAFFGNTNGSWNAIAHNNGASSSEIEFNFLAGNRNGWDNADAGVNNDEHAGNADFTMKFNTMLGARNGALNGGSYGDSTVEILDNFVQGSGTTTQGAEAKSCGPGGCPNSLSENGQAGLGYTDDRLIPLGAPDPTTITSDVHLLKNTVFGDESGSENGVADFGSAHATLFGNFVQGDENLRENGNGEVGATADLIANIVFGENTASTNGNADVNGTGFAHLENNFFVGSGAASKNGNSLFEGFLPSSSGFADMQNNSVLGEGSLANNGQGGLTGSANIQNNQVFGVESVTDNGNQVTEIPGIGPNGDPEIAPTGHGSADVVGNYVAGDGSLSHNNDLANDGTVTLLGNKVIGNESGNSNGDEFNFNTIIGNGSGNEAGRFVQNNTVIGDGSGNGYATGATGNIVYGDNAGNKVNGINNIALGNGAGNSITASNSVAIGTNALAGGNSGVAIGDNAFAAGPNDTALGANARVTADHSTALGADAVANKDHLVAIGTASDTYRTPGITSGQSKSRQSGPLEVVTSDAAGNLATDGGEIFTRLDQTNSRIDQAFRRINENEAGVALALAAVNPDLVDGERFGVSANWGNFAGANAFGMGFEGVLGHDWITRGDRVAITGGFGLGFLDNGDDVFGGRVGAQWTWGNKAIAYAAPPSMK